MVRLQNVDVKARWILNGIRGSGFAENFSIRPFNLVHRLLVIVQIHQ